MLYWIQILPPIGGATSMDFFATQIACLIAAKVKKVKKVCEVKIWKIVLKTPENVEYVAKSVIRDKYWPFNAYLFYILACDHAVLVLADLRPLAELVGLVWSAENLSWWALGQCHHRLRLLGDFEAPSAQLTKSWQHHNQEDGHPWASHLLPEVSQECHFLCVNFTESWTTREVA